MILSFFLSFHTVCQAPLSLSISRTPQPRRTSPEPLERLPDGKMASPREEARSENPRDTHKETRANSPSDSLRTPAMTQGDVASVSGGVTSNIGDPQGVRKRRVSVFEEVSEMLGDQPIHLCQYGFRISVEALPDSIDDI